MTTDPPTRAPQLITYADRLAGDIAGVEAFVDGTVAGAFGGVHLLPFFVPIDGADAGFDPVDHTAVDPRIGSWDDVRRLADDAVGGHDATAAGAPTQTVAGATLESVVTQIWRVTTWVCRLPSRSVKG